MDRKLFLIPKSGQKLLSLYYHVFVICEQFYLPLPSPHSSAFGECINTSLESVRKFGIFLTKFEFCDLQI
jgi:hypothetical protein